MSTALSPTSAVRTLKTDANGNLLVAVSGGTSLGGPASKVPTSLASNAANVAQPKDVSFFPLIGLHVDSPAVSAGVPTVLHSVAGSGVLTFCALGTASATSGNITVELLIDGTVVSTHATGTIAISQGFGLVGYNNNQTLALEAVPFTTGYSVRITSTVAETAARFRVGFRHRIVPA